MVFGRRKIPEMYLLHMKFEKYNKNAGKLDWYEWLRIELESLRKDLRKLDDEGVIAHGETYV
jgi:hypothetical protein